jgi:uncharacterized damage-inducible protein DinB
MKTQEVKLIFDYNYWANKKLLNSAAKLSREQFVAPADFPHGSLLGTLLHTLDAEYGWRILCEKGLETKDLLESDFPTISSLEDRWHDEETAMRAYLTTLKDNDLSGIIRYTTPSGINRERVLWHCLFHVVNHGTQHRSEAAAILTGFNQSPGDFDFSMFAIEKK